MDPYASAPPATALEPAPVGQRTEWSELDQRAAIRLFLIYLGTMLLVGPFLVTMGALPVAISRAMALGDPQHIALVSKLSVLLCPHLALIAVVYCGWRRLRGEDRQHLRREVGICSTSTASCLIAAVLGAVVPMTYYSGLQWIEPAGHTPAPMLFRGWGAAYQMTGALLLISPVEEFLFRGYLFAGVRQSRGTAVAAISTTLVFWLLHMDQGFRAWYSMIPIAAFSLIAIGFRIRTGSLLPSIVAHASYYIVLFSFL
jgi:membrane protease YdiL (CAAX protease family)